METGLFSAVVALFIVESYKKLSPDSGDRTVALLEQISQQLAGFQNATFPPSQNSTSFSPSRAIICVNVLWFLSLVTGIVSAFYVMLVQQWVRRYTQMIQDLSSNDGPVRSTLFLGTQKYRMSHAVGLTPLPLHISVFLFFSGLIIFLFTISNIVANAVTVCVAIFGLAYFVLTILPTIDHVCPYFTPMSDMWCYVWRALLSVSAYCLRLAVRCLYPRRPLRWLKLAGWLINLEHAIEKHNQHLQGGLRGIIVRRVIDAPMAVDLKALSWLLQRPVMAENSNIQDFIASVPGETLTLLMNAPKDSGKITFSEHLSALLRSCAPGTVGLKEDVRKGRLLVCLNALHHIVKATFIPCGDLPSLTLMSNVRVKFASMETMRTLWADSDPAIRVTSRSICALLARYFLQPSYQCEDSELAWLGDVVGTLPNAGADYSNYIVTANRMNLKSFVYGILSNQTDGLPLKHAIFFAETLAILMNAGGQAILSRDIFEEQLTALIQWIENDDDQRRDKVVSKLRDIHHGIKRPSLQERRYTV